MRKIIIIGNNDRRAKNIKIKQKKNFLNFTPLKGKRQTHGGSIIVIAISFRRLIIVVQVGIDI